MSKIKLTSEQKQKLMKKWEEICDPRNFWMASWWMEEFEKLEVEEDKELSICPISCLNLEECTKWNRFCLHKESITNNTLKRLSDRSANKSNPLTGFEQEKVKDPNEDYQPAKCEHKSNGVSTTEGIGLCDKCHKYYRIFASKPNQTVQPERKEWKGCKIHYWDGGQDRYWAISDCLACNAALEHNESIGLGEVNPQKCTCRWGKFGSMAETSPNCPFHSKPPQLEDIEIIRLAIDNSVGVMSGNDLKLESAINKVIKRVNLLSKK